MQLHLQHKERNAQYESGPLLGNTVIIFREKNHLQMRLESEFYKKKYKYENKAVGFVYKYVCIPVTV